MPPTAMTSVEWFHINHFALATRALICFVTLTVELLTLKLVRITWGGQLPTKFGVYETFHSRLMYQHLSEAPRDLATLTFDLGGHGACW